MVYCIKRKAGESMTTLVEGDIPNNVFNASQKVQLVGMDIETTRLPMIGRDLDKTSGKIALVQLYIPKYGTVILRQLSAFPTNLIRLLESNVTKIFHSATFDLYFLMRDFPLFPNNIADTYIAARFYDPKKTIFRKDDGTGSHSLATLVKTIFGYEMDKSLAVSDWQSDTLTPQQLEYAAKDVEYLPALLDHMEKRISVDYIPNLLNEYRSIPHKVMLELKTH